MKKFLILLLAVCLLLCSVPVLAADPQTDVSVTSGCRTLDAQLPLLGAAQLVSNTSAAVLYETNTDTLMYAQNADNPIEPASLLKIMTALVAIEKGKMDDVVTVREEVLSTLAADAVVVDLTVDEVVTVKDLLYCMMVASGNDAAVVLADHVMGDQQAFVAEMNRYAAELGCTGTNFTNVHGLDDDAQYTTARDISRILAHAIKNPQFSEFFNAKEYEMPATNKSEARKLTSQNYLINNDKVEIYYDERVTGGRTAVCSDQTRSLAITAQQNDMNLVCVVTGAKSQYEKDGYTVKVFGGYAESKQLLDLCFTGYKTAQILSPDQVLKQSSVLNGNCDVTVGARTGVSAVVATGATDNGLVYRYADEVGLSAPIQKGQTLASLQIWQGAVCVAQTEVYAMNNVAVAGTVFEEDNGKSITLGTGKVILLVIGGIVALVLCAFGVLYIVRTVRIFKVKRQSMRNRRNRRRSR